MQATIETKQDPRLVEGVDAACHDISQNRQIGHSNATGLQLRILYCNPSSAAGGDMQQWTSRQEYIL